MTNTTYSVLTSCTSWYIYLEIFHAINPLRQPIHMQIFSLGNLYIGKDDKSFTTVQIHLGQYVLEWERNPKSNELKPTTEESN